MKKEEEKRIKETEERMGKVRRERKVRKRMRKKGSWEMKMSLKCLRRTIKVRKIVNE